MKIKKFDFDKAYYIFKKIRSTEEKIIECVGPEEFTFKQIIEKLLALMEKKRLFLPIPIFCDP